MENKADLCKKVFEFSADAIAITDLEGKLIDTSKNTFEMLGYPVDIDFSGKIIYDFVNEKDRKLAIKLIKDMVVPRKRITTEFLVNKSDGSLLEVEVIGNVISSYENDIPEYLLFNIRDITNRKKTENKLQYQVKLQDLLTQISNNYINIPSDKVKVEINKALAILGEFVEADRFYIFDYDFEKKITNNTYEWCAEGIKPQIDNLQGVNLDDIPDWTSPHLLNKALYIDDVYALPDDSVVKHILEPQGVKSILTVPIIDDEECVGFLGFDAVNHYNIYSKDDENVLRVFAQILVNLRKKIKFENHIKANEHKYKVLFEDSPDGYLLMDFNRVFLECNESILRLTGLDKSSIIGKTPVDLSPEFQFDGKRSDELATLYTNQVVEKGFNIFDWIITKADGSELIVEVNLTKITISNKEVVFIVWRDITLRKKYELEIQDLNRNLEKKVVERTVQIQHINEQLLKEIEERKLIENALKSKTRELENFFDVSLDLLCIADTDGNFIKVNKAWSELLGYSTFELEKKKFLEFVHPNDMKDTIEKINELKKQQKVIKFVNRYKTSNDTYRYIEWNSTPVGNYIYAAARDITEKIYIQKTLMQNIEKEKELNDLKSRFISIASHEFRGPLANILMLGEILLSSRGKLSENEIDSKLNKINEQVLHLDSVVSNVMQVTRIQEGKFNFNPSKHDFVEICKDVVQINNSNKQLKYKVEFISDFDNLVLNIDKRLMTQAIQNLVSNAIKYSQPNPIVKISLFQDDSDVVFRINDNGMGIPENDIKQVFDSFFRANNAANYEGNGLGLSIVKEIIVLHGGNINVYSKISQGSTFYIRLPLNDYETSMK